MERRRIFGTNGIRGVVNKDLTAKFALEIGQSIGTIFNSGRILLGRDGRSSGMFLSSAVASGLMASGCSVYDVDMIPTPGLQYVTKAWGFDGGVVITASHNPAEYNGIKVMEADGIEIPTEKEVKIEEIYYKRGWKVAEWESIGKMNVKTGAIQDYKDAIKLHVDREKIEKAGLKVVIDPANSVGALVSPTLLSELGCRVYTVNANIDGSFPGRNPEPTLNNLGALCQAVRASGSNLGIAYDGDADRAIFVDERGQPHWGDKSFGIVEKFFLNENPGEKVVTPVSSSQMVEEIAERYGGEVVWTKVGSTIVSRKMLEVNAKLGGEENGGVFYGPHLAVRDGAMTSALIVEIVAKTRKKLSRLVKELPTYHIYKDKVPCPNQVKQRVLERLLEETKEGRVETVDGVKIRFPDKSWILIRPSGTEPIYRLYSEAKTRGRTMNLISKYKSLLERLIKNML